MKKYLCLSLLIFGLLFAGCEKKKESPAESVQKPEPVASTVPQEQPASEAPDFSKIISAHTSGLVSKYDAITVRFTKNIVGESQIGESTDGIVKFKPSVKGDTRWISRYELEFRPSDSLQQKANYTAYVDLSKILPKEDVPGEFSFSFNVRAQSYDVKMETLEPISGESSKLQLSGYLITADTATSENVEKILSADQEGDALNIDWEHKNLVHKFVIKDVRRLKEDSLLKVHWSGDSIGVGASGQKNFEVPAQGDFKVIKVEAISESSQYVSIHFSDSLAEGQNLEGLVYFKKKSSTHTIEDNKIKLFLSRSMQGVMKVVVEPGIRNRIGDRLLKKQEFQIFFASKKPEVKFVGSGVILPQKSNLMIPFEAINLKEIQVTAFQVYDNNMGQFLQENSLKGKQGLKRVGRYLWRKSIPLNDIAGNVDKWTRYHLDVSDLLQQHPSNLFQLSISFNRGNSIYSCNEKSRNTPIKKEAPYKNYNDLNSVDRSNWDYYEGMNSYSAWRNRDNPCHDAYYLYGNSRVKTKNLMTSNMGLSAKQGEDDKLVVVTTDILTTEPIENAEIKVYNFQRQLLGQGNTNDDGLASIKISGVPFYLEAKSEKERGYLKLNQGTVLPVSHFDVGGVVVKKGVKGHIYAERGVWRPGDNIFLTFVLQDKKQVLPDNHPVSIELFNPSGQLVLTAKPENKLNEFYTFKLSTSEESPTGNWKANVRVGGLSFSKALKIETVVPNRLKVELDFGKEELSQADSPLKAKLFSQWLHGAKASKLKADAHVTLRPSKTKFKIFTDYIFDDPARVFKGKKQLFWEGRLDKNGKATVRGSIKVNDSAPGFLKAYFNSRVFEEGGAFSSDSFSVPFHPYESYLGIKLPKGDKARGMLLTDVKHKVKLASLDRNGKRSSIKNVKINLYKIDWKWWWDKTGDNLTEYASSNYHRSIASGETSTVNGKGEWEFEIKYPDWGRYLVRACDERGEHCTGKVFYVDWPGWAGRAGEEKGVGASMLSVSSDKSKYEVGEIAKIKLPPATQGRALISIENGTTVLDQFWVKPDGNNKPIDVEISKAMSPNVYVHVTLFQPHTGKKNDRPIRLYGVTPLLVDDKDTLIQPELFAEDELHPQMSTTLQVKEKNGKPFTYTVAIVDEGLLGLTRYKTPNLRNEFYKKESLGVKTWDLFDDVIGAYGGELERILSLGGDGIEKEKQREKKKRFPPVVIFKGPYELKAGEQNQHNIQIPKYIGAVRVMIVAGTTTAYGYADKSIPVKQPLMLLTTLPRVLGPGEEISLPVSVFTMSSDIKSVNLKLVTNQYFKPTKDKTKKLAFDKEGEQIALFKVKTKERIGQGRVQIIAQSSEFKADTETYINIRPPNPVTTKTLSKVIKFGEQWKTNIVPHGMASTNELTLEVSSVPPLNLEKRLGYLIRYPHGCIEQVTSALFPQLYLHGLVNLDNQQRQKTETHIKKGLDKLIRFQRSSGGFAYWPSGKSDISHWGTNYAGHFITEAEKAGYAIPAQMKSRWISFQKEQAKKWDPNSNQSSLTQAYRLFTLSRAGSPEIGAMNRFRETAELNSATKWFLAAAYHHMGLTDAAQNLITNDTFQVDDYEIADATYGSSLRDKALIVYSLSLMGMADHAESLVKEISEALSSTGWHSTHSTAFSLLALSQYVGLTKDAKSYPYKISYGKLSTSIEASTPISMKRLHKFPDKGSTFVLDNLSDRTLYATVAMSGIAKASSEPPVSKNLELSVVYSDSAGTEIDIAKLDQGKDYFVTVEVKNTSDKNIQNIALTHLVPSGWEINNERFLTETSTTDVDYQDIRDDRILSYFSLKKQDTKTIKTRFNASYLGKFYLPSINVEAMYNAEIRATTKGLWTKIAKPE